MNREGCVDKAIESVSASSGGGGMFPFFSDLSKGCLDPANTSQSLFVCKVDKGSAKALQSSPLYNHREISSGTRLAFQKNRTKIDKARSVALPLAGTRLNMHPTKEGGYGQFLSEIEQLIELDQRNILEATFFFSSSDIHLTENNPSLTSACQQLIRTYQRLFEDEVEFQSLWNRFIGNVEVCECLQELIPVPITIENPTGIRCPEFDLEAMAYHSRRHANEMHQDTYRSLKKLNLAESTCQVAAMTAFFHDLIQKVDDLYPIPHLAKNERVNVKILHFMIDELPLEPKIQQALKHFTNASLVGGTFLINVLTAQGEKRSVSLAEHSDSMISCCSELRETLHIIKTIRKVLAENDVSRMLRKEGVVMTRSVRENRIIAQLTASLRLSISTEELLDFTRRKRGEENFGAHLIGRLFQSIRFLVEINQVSVKEIRDPKVSRGEALEKIPHSFVEKLKDSTTWIEGDFSELVFALQSNHIEYANFIRDFSVLIRAADSLDLKDLVFLALTEGQEGNFITVLP